MAALRGPSSRSCHAGGRGFESRRSRLAFLLAGRGDQPTPGCPVEWRRAPPVRSTSPWPAGARSRPERVPSTRCAPSERRRENRSAGKKHGERQEANRGRAAGRARRSQATVRWSRLPGPRSGSGANGQSVGKLGAHARPVCRSDRARRRNPCHDCRRMLRQHLPSAALQPPPQGGEAPVHRSQPHPGLLLPRPGITNPPARLPRPRPAAIHHAFIDSGRPSRPPPDRGAYLPLQPAGG